MDDEEYEVHPLDRDYSEPEPKPKRLPRMPEGNVHRAGVIIFSIGFVALLVTAGLLGAFRGVGVVETFGSYVHRFAMVMILVGGILIIVGLRVRSWSLIDPQKAKIKSADFRALVILLVVNILAFPFMQGITTFLRETFSTSGAAMSHSGLMTILTGLMALAAILHRGVIRGYAVGFVVAVLMGSMGGLAFFNYYGGRNASFIFAQQLLTVQITGMACATYAAFFEKPSRK